MTVTGLLAPPHSMAVVLGGSEAEVLALEPGKPRDVTVISNDREYAESFSASTDDPQPRTIRLKPAGSGVGRVSVPLLDARLPP